VGSAAFAPNVGFDEATSGQNHSFLGTYQSDGGAFSDVSDLDTIPDYGGGGGGGRGGKSVSFAGVMPDFGRGGVDASNVLDTIPDYGGSLLPTVRGGTSGRDVGFDALSFATGGGIGFDSGLTLDVANRTNTAGSGLGGSFANGNLGHAAGPTLDILGGAVRGDAHSTFGNDEIASLGAGLGASATASEGEYGNAVITGVVETMAEVMGAIGGDADSHPLSAGSTPVSFAGDAY